MPLVLLRLSDLIARGIVNNRSTLKNWINRQGFPPGRLVGNQRLWREDEIEAWFEAQSSDLKPVVLGPNHVSRNPHLRKPRRRMEAA